MARPLSALFLLIVLMSVCDAASNPFQVWRRGNFTQSRCDKCVHTNRGFLSPECTSVCYVDPTLETPPEIIGSRFAWQLEQLSDRLSDSTFYTYPVGEDQNYDINRELKFGPQPGADITRGKILVSSKIIYTYQNPWPSPSPIIREFQADDTVIDESVRQNGKQPLFCRQLNRGLRLPAQIQFEVTARKNSRQFAVNAMVKHLRDTGTDWLLFFRGKNNKAFFKLVNINQRKFKVTIDFNLKFKKEVRDRCSS